MNRFKWFITSNIMKIIVTGIHGNTPAIDDSNLSCRVKDIVEIYTLYGIYIMHDNKVKQKVIYDRPLREETIDKHNIKIDNSIVKYISNVTCIDSNHYINTFKRYEYSLRENAKIILVIEKKNSKIHEIYFETNEDIKNYSIKEDFTTLLSLLS